jgi:hypothetical protein
MRDLASFMVASVLVAVPCCGRTDLGRVVTGTGGAMALGGIAATGGAPATGGMSGTGGSPSTSVGSTSTWDVDACSSDDDCTTSCTWTTAPTNSSQCFAEYCCGSNWMSKRRCEANQAAWAIYCPNQSSTFIDCPCITLCDTPAQTITLGCVGGKCEFVCSPPVSGAGGSTVLPPGNGGYVGNDGSGGVGGADAGSGGSSASSIPAGAFLSVSVSDSLDAPGYACAVRTDGTIGCWGDNSFGKATPPAGTFTSVSAGAFAACGLKTDGTISCWGDNAHGESAPPAGKFASVSAGEDYACGIQATGSIACWGDNVYGEATPPAGVFTSISAGVFTGCGVRADGTVACWGNNGDNQASPPSGNFISVSVGDSAACGVKTDGTVACWGDNSGYNDRETWPPTGAFASISASVTAACGVRADGSVACWGGSGAGDTSTPEEVSPAGTFSSVSAGRPLACAVNSADRSIACWALPLVWSLPTF